MNKHSSKGNKLLTLKYLFVYPFNVNNHLSDINAFYRSIIKQRILILFSNNVPTRKCSSWKPIFVYDDIIE